MASISTSTSSSSCGLGLLAGAAAATALMGVTFARSEYSICGQNNNRLLINYSCREGFRTVGVTVNIESISVQKEKFA